LLTTTPPNRSRENHPRRAPQPITEAIALVLSGRYRIEGRRVVELP
jgi:hypothetical protein